MRPGKLEDFVGQQHLLGDGKPLRLAIERGDVTSMVFWGPPGSGKTTLARLIANYTDRQFEPRMDIRLRDEKLAGWRDAVRRVRPDVEAP